MTIIDEIREYHQEDPTYTRYNAYQDYLSYDITLAERIAKKYWSDFDNDSEIMDYDSLMDRISTMNGIDAFRLGTQATGLKGPFDWSSRYFRLGGDGNVESISDIQYRKLYMDAAKDAYEFVISGKIPINEGLEEVLRIFD